METSLCEVPVNFDVPLESHRGFPFRSRANSVGRISTTVQNSSIFFPGCQLNSGESSRVGLDPYWVAAGRPILGCSLLEWPV